MTTFNEAASAGYKSLLNLYQPEVFPGNFWFAGNTLHCCLDYLVNSKQHDDGGILRKAYGIYQDLNARVDWWVDDYGWWGNAFLIALYNWQALGYQAPRDDQLREGIIGATKHCWDKLAGHWSDDSYNEGGEDHAAGSAPIRGGTFNLKDPDQPMSGRNTVTNLGFLLLSRGLALLNPNDPDAPKYAEMATAEFQWFDKWLGIPGSLRTAQDLVLERPRGNVANPEWHWTGDQGQFVLAMGSGSEVSHKVAAAVLKRMIDNDDILHEYEISGALEGFIADYATGKGVFMRCMQGLYGASGGSAVYKDFVRNNAASVWATATQASGGACQFRFNWSRRPGVWEPETLSGKDPQLCDLILQTAGQDALNAALALGLGNETIT